ncbi:CHY zinc finger domain-containing protein [Hamiltosporidium tvaerminnensis]|uniref:CHY zinc finger domain-containing protein n=3 Tax=Hamiltosporidium TaxID=1176354 RepID=A0A4Q9LR46_9MICR|nr:CHY zinc finger domain-containing protein [Hamiltosporidium magnivora]TBU09890.1 CHY zinc finger domain-containing protein [Hamiltosporidium tvaerminnensis]TBU11939.1 CHY zinc finger domain-containing protein [Hamiltosporidium tvaerminnensis]
MYQEEPFGCTHYKRNCLIVADCCKRTYPCRFCHDDNEDHSINRYKIREMLCLYCGLIQEVSNQCCKCNKKMAEYFCAQCKFWSNSTEEIFHCAKCKMCRIGPQNRTFHCTDCNACMNKDLYNNHIHIENTLKSNCPICAEYMFTSIKNLTLLNCGHSIHTECLEYYIKGSHQCPICLKSIGDMNLYNQKIDFILSNNLKLYKDTDIWMCEISCFDCKETSKSFYRFLFNKCQICKSYNTRTGDVYKE